MENLKETFSGLPEDDSNFKIEADAIKSKAMNIINTIPPEALQDTKLSDSFQKTFRDVIASVVNDVKYSKFYDEEQKNLTFFFANDYLKKIRSHMKI